MQILWTLAAVRDLDAVKAFVSRDNPAAAIDPVLRVIQAVERLLPEIPHIGQAGCVPGTRELVIPGTPHLVAYRVRRKNLEILRVLHHAQQWPDNL